MSSEWRAKPLITHRSSLITHHSLLITHRAMLNALWLIPAAPFIGFVINGLFGKRAGKTFVSAVAIIASLAAAVFGTVAIFQYHAAYPHGERYVNVLYNWFNSGGIGADVAFQLDPLSIVMLLVVTWVGFLIYLYSVGY